MFWSSVLLEIPGCRHGNGRQGVNPESISARVKTTRSLVNAVANERDNS
jgi:hypothetical protein